MLEKEIGTARNIKDKKTRKQVIRALKSSIRRLNMIQLPDNGLFLYANVKDVWMVVPEYKNIIDDYHCGKRFRTDYLKSPGEPVGVLYLSTKECRIVIRKSGLEELIYKITSGIPSKHSKGGQSQGRFHRKHNEAIKAFLKRVKQYTDSLDLSTWEVKGDLQVVSLFNKL